MKNPLSKEELINNEELCQYCFSTEYGLSMNACQPSAYSSGCEGSYCDEAYEYYLDNFEEE